MKRLTVLALALWCPAMAFHNFEASPDTAVIGTDTVLLTGDYEKVGDTAAVTAFFLDVNTNGVFDQGADMDLLQGQQFPIIDGIAVGTEGPQDTEADGKMSLAVPTAPENQGPFSIPGTFVMTISSGGVADTVHYVLVETPTSTYVKGTVTAPAGTPAANVRVNLQVRDTADERVFNAQRLTDTQGNYLFFLDAGYRNKTVILEIDDQTPRDPSWTIPPSVDTLLIDSLVGIDLVFGSTSHFVKGTVVDDKGSPVASAPFYLHPEASSSASTFNFSTDTAGRFLVGIEPGNYSLHLETWNYPGYLMKRIPVTVAESDDTVALAFTILRSDDTISGKVHDDSSALGDGTRLAVEFEGILADTSYRARGDLGGAGGYGIPVSTRISTYTLTFRAEKLPPMFFVAPSGYLKVAPGTDTCDVWILKGSAQISGTVRDSAGNPLRQASVLVADTAKDLYLVVPCDTSGFFKQTVPSGTFAVAFTTTINGRQLVGTAGPMVITDRDTVLDITGAYTPFVKVAGPRDARPLTFGLSAIQTNTRAAFRFVAPYPAKARLSLYNLEGRQVSMLLDGQVAAGVHTIDWSTHQNLLKAGQVYLARIDLIGKHQREAKVLPFTVLR